MGIIILAGSMGGWGGNNSSHQFVEAQNVGTVEKRSITTEEYVKRYFSDIPIMIEIARCESRFRQHDKDGSVLRGEINNLDRGVMQINEYYHGEDAEKLGYDILSIEGNSSYARYLYEKYGTSPWNSSKGCWGGKLAYNVSM